MPDRLIRQDDEQHQHQPPNPIATDPGWQRKGRSKRAKCRSQNGPMSDQFFILHSDFSLPNRRDAYGTLRPATFIRLFPIGLLLLPFDFLLLTFKEASRLCPSLMRSADEVFHRRSQISQRNFEKNRTSIERSMRNHFFVIFAVFCADSLPLFF